jgi:hypothetical protein
VVVVYVDDVSEVYASIFRVTSETSAISPTITRYNKPNNTINIIETGQVKSSVMLLYVFQRYSTAISAKVLLL